MLIGYARISTADQTLDLQLDALKKAGCEQIFTDRVSGTKAERKGLTEALSHLRACLVKVRVRMVLYAFSMRKPYPTDLSDTEWICLRSYLPTPPKGPGKTTHPLPT
jgi:Resolvase, N terminal domain